MAAQNKVQFVVEAVDKASPVMKDIEKNSGSMSKTVSSNFQSLVAPSTAFAAAMGGAAIGLGVLWKQAISEAANLEQTKIAFTTMIWSAEEANNFVKDMISFAAKTPFEIKGLETASKQLLAYGFNQKEVLPNLKNLGDIAAGVWMDKLPQLILAFWQVKAATKLTWNELRQFTEAGVPLLDELAKVMWKPVNVIQDMVSKWQIGFPIVQQAMANLSGEGGRFNNLMEKQSATFSWMMSNLSDSWTNFLRTAGQPLLEVWKKILSWLLDLVNNWLPKAMEAMQNFWKILQENKPLVLGIAAAIITALVPALVAAAVAAAPFLLAAAKLIAISAAIGAAVYWLAQLWESNFLWIQDKTKAVWDYLTAAFSYIQTNWLPPIQAFIQQVGQEFMKIANEWLPIITNALQGIWTIISTVFGAILAVVTPIVSALVSFISDNWWTIKAMTSAVFDAIGAFFQITFWTWIWMFKAFLQVLGGDWSGAWETIKWTFSDTWNAMTTIFSSAWEILSGAITLAWNALKEFLFLEWEWLKVIFGALWDAVAAIASAAWEWIKMTATTVWGAISTAIKTIWNGIANTASVVYNWIKDFIFWTFTSVVDWFVGAGKKLFEGWFTWMLDWLGGIAKNIFNAVVWTIEGFVNKAIWLINKLISAANSVAGTVWINIPTVQPISIWRLAHGGIAGEWFFGGRAYANGGVVSWPAGIDKVPAMLTAGEVVLNAAQQQNLARQLNWSNQPSINVTISGNSFFGDDERFVEKIGDKIIENFKMHYAFQSF